MAEATANSLVNRLAATDPTTIVDIGCGWAELLLRLLSTCQDAHGHGIDHDSTLIARAKANAKRRSLSDRAEFTTEVRTPIPSDLALCIGAEHVFGTAAEALSALTAWVHPGGHLAFGTLFWEQPPSSQQLTDFGHLATLPELVSQASVSGWQVGDMRTASLEDWDDFEFRFAADWEQQAISASTLEETNMKRQTYDSYIADYVNRRGVLGFAYLILRPRAEHRPNPS
jgi:hypothetical protein